MSFKVIRKLLYRNFLLVYRTGHWLRRHFTHGGMLILYGAVAAFVFGINTRQTLSYQIFTLLFSILLLSFISVLIFNGRFRIKRELPDYGAVGQKLEYSITIENLSRKKFINLTLQDELAGDLPEFRQFMNTPDIHDKQRNFFDRLIGYPRLLTLIRKLRGGVVEPVEINNLAPNTSIHKKIELIPVRRGYLRFSRSFIGKVDPFGLLRRFKRFENAGTLLVLPRLYEFPRIILTGKRTYQHGGVNMATSIGDSQEFFSLRDYRPGDPMRAIHWRSYAKTGTPVVKEYQDEYFTRLGLVLDTYQGNKPDIVFEEAVSVAASIAVSSQQPDSLLDLMFIKDKAYRFTTGRGLAGVDNILEILASVDAHREDNLLTLETLLLQHIADTSGFICILLDWNKKRQEMIRRLRVAGIPMMIFVIAQNNDDMHYSDEVAMSVPGFFHVLQAGNIRESLSNTGLQS